MITKMFGIGKEVAEPVVAVGKALDGLFTSDEERLTKAEILERTKQDPVLWQHTIDLVNANSSAPIVQLARPFCVYVAGFNALQMGVGVLWLNVRDIPEWFITMTTTGFLGALGIYGALRTAEKIGGKVK